MKTYQILLLITTWLMTAMIGMDVLLVYDSTPGRNEQSPGVWPPQSEIPRPAGLPTLLLFAHPNCPCTRASIGELAVLMAHCQSRVRVYVLFYKPQGEGDEWTHTDLWLAAEAVPGVRVLADKEGDEARRFNATTSGHVLLYDSAGQLMFTGGITSSRSHYGDNDGLSAITALLHHQPTTIVATPVYGCSLLNPKPGGDVKEPACIR